MIFYCVGIAVLIIVDQAVKVLVDRHMMFGDTIPVIDNFFHITYVQNRGIAFGVFQGKINAISIATTIAIIGIIIYFFKNFKKIEVIERIAYMVIISGAIGNMIDRIFRGYVVDMLDFRGIWQYVFNLADVYINIGVALIFLDILLKLKNKESQN